MYRDQEKIKEKLQDFFDIMINVANEDDVITEDERKILDSIEQGIENLETQLMQILESELTDEEFVDLEKQVLQDIVKNVTLIAEEDDVVTSEESNLIKRLEAFADSGVVSHE